MSGAASEHLKDHVIVRAGAGAGKTHRLTHQVLDTAQDFFAKEERFPRMIVTTFTRKATQELRERLMVTALKERPQLIDFVNSRSHLVVSTIHGVLDIYLKRYGGHISLDPGYAIMSSSEAERLGRQVLRQILVASDDYQSLLEIFGFNSLVGLMRRLNETYLREPEVRPHSAETFAALLHEKLWALNEEIGALCDDIEAESQNESWLNFAKSFRLLGKKLVEGDWTKNRATILAQIENIENPRFLKAKPAVDEATNEKKKELLDQVKDLGDAIYDPAEWTAIASIFSVLEKMGREFSEKLSAEKMRLGQFEISDLELLAMRCMREFPETVRSFAEEWDFWLIDEYQDTSPFQVELIRQLSAGKPNFIVGDPQQSIYLFRGARSEVFQDKEHEIQAGGGKLDLLDKNYRSRPELLLFFNDLFSRLEIPFRPMKENLKEGEKLEPSRQVAKFVVLPETEDETVSSDEQELMAIVRHAQDLLGAGAHPEDICVLARTNQTLLDVATYLSRYHLPTHVHAASGFYSRRETLDALALLKFLVNPYDNLNTVQLLRSPWFRVADDKLVSSIGVEGQISHWEKICRALGEEEAVQRLKLWLARRSEIGISEVFSSALVEAGFIDLSHAHDHSGRRESNVWKLVTQLAAEENRPGFNYLDFVSQSERDLREASGAEESDAIAAVEPNRINLMTIHSSKGLQFKHVILPRMGREPRLTTHQEFTFDEDNKLWAARVPRGEELKPAATLAEKAWLEIFRAQEKQEHARVFYVALTRAVESVFMSWTGQPKRNSWASMLRWDLEPGEHAMSSYRYFVETQAQAPAASTKSSSAAFAPRSAWRTKDNDALRVKQTTSVTEILDRAAARGSVQSIASIPERLRLASQGTSVHRLLEALKSPTTESVRNLIMRWFPGKEEKVAKSVEYVTKLQDPPLADLIRNGYVEWGFAFLHNGTLIEGQIDLWARDEKSKTVWVADYKTGSPKAKDKAFKQLALYALALRKGGEVKEGDKVRLAAVYPFSEETYINDEPASDYYEKLFSQD